MASSSIEWTNKTWNPTTGCTHISKECDFCYAEKETFRKMHNPKSKKYKLGFDVIVEHAYTLEEPYRWKEPCTVFVNSMSDLFHKDISLDFIKKVFEVMNDTPQHTYQVLTKRHDILEKYSDQLNWTDNIWMGVSVGTQIATRRIKSLVNCGAKYKFLSVEPLIEEIKDYDLTGIDWVIVGGESGSNAVRPMERDWVIKVKEKCVVQNVPFFFKQWGKIRNNPNPQDPTINKLHRYHSKGGCELDGKVYWTNPTITNDSMPTINLFDRDYLIMDEFEDLNTIWELKSYLPIIDNDLFESLKEDIKKNGVNDPIIYITIPNGQKLVIEGHTRLRAVISLNLKIFPTKELNETFNSLDEIKLWMVKHQLGRRNLTIGERVKLAFHSKPTIEKLAKENLSKGGKAFSKKRNEKTDEEEIEKIDTYLEIAKIANVGRTTVVKYSQIVNSGLQATIDNVNKGAVSISSAHASLKNKIETANKIEVQKAQSKKIESKESENIIILQSIDEGKQKISTGDIDVMMIFDKTDKLDILKQNSKVKIGVYYLD
jgi:protein gp37